MKDIYQSSYYHTCFEIQKGFNIGWQIGEIDENKLNKVVSTPWAPDGRSFSDRIWQQKNTMVNELQQQLTRDILWGRAPDQAIEAMTKYVKDKTRNAKANAGRLVMTEEAYISSAAQKDAFNDLDVEEFEIVATLDSHTSEICRQMDGQHFPMKDFQPGVTAPPFHPFCRSTTVPYFDDEFSLGERAARDEAGNTYYVPSNMKYGEWKKAFVDGETDGLQSIGDGIVNKITQSNIDRVPLVKVGDLDDSTAELMKQAHKDVLTTAMNENQSMEVAKIYDSNFNLIDTAFGSAKEIKMNASSRAVFVAHNHPNNSSFSNQDLSWLINNNQIRYFSIVKNNGSIEMIYLPDTFDRNKFAVEYNRLMKKYKNLIESNEQNGYTKLVGELLEKTKSGLVYVR